MSLSEIICAVCWFNPCAWLLKREIRWNLEFLADRSTLNSGCDREHYQFHLLRLTYQKTVFQLVNNFNVSPLKKRILMMNKKQTSKSTEVKPDTIRFNPPRVVEDEEIRIVGFGRRPSDPDSIYSIVEDMPQFPGGIDSLIKFVSKNLIYPEDAVINKVQGQVNVRFVVGKEGIISNAEVVKSLSASCDSAALAVVRRMPDWIPGKDKGKAVDVFYRLPIKFRLAEQ
jgi:TonB family protein